MAPQFHATRLEWVYLTVLGSIPNSSFFIQKAHEMGYLVCGTVNSNLPDKTDGSPITYTIGRARDMDNEYISYSWLPGTNNGCTNTPDYKTLWLTHAMQ